MTEIYERVLAERMKKYSTTREVVERAVKAFNTTKPEDGAQAFADSREARAAIPGDSYSLDQYLRYFADKAKGDNYPPFDLPLHVQSIPALPRDFFVLDPNDYRIALFTSKQGADWFTAVVNAYSLEAQGIFPTTNVTICCENCEQLITVTVKDTELQENWLAYTHESCKDGGIYLGRVEDVLVFTCIDCQRIFVQTDEGMPCDCLETTCVRCIEKTAACRGCKEPWPLSRQETKAGDIFTEGSAASFAGFSRINALIATLVILLVLIGFAPLVARSQQSNPPQQTETQAKQHNKDGSEVHYCNAPTKVGGKCKRHVKHEGDRCFMHRV